MTDDLNDFFRKRTGRTATRDDTDAIFRSLFEKFPSTTDERSLVPVSPQEDLGVEDLVAVHQGAQSINPEITQEDVKTTIQELYATKNEMPEHGVGMSRRNKMTARIVAGITAFGILGAIAYGVYTALKPSPTATVPIASTPLIEPRLVALTPQKVLEDILANVMDETIADDASDMILLENPRGRYTVIKKGDLTYVLKYGEGFFAETQVNIYFGKADFAKRPDLEIWDLKDDASAESLSMPPVMDYFKLTDFENRHLKIITDKILHRLYYKYAPFDISIDAE